MRLLSLELHGFKSFPERTKISFDEGMTVIVGPNGSGKSNISDAVKWVLGEISAKNIRGAKLEDVIFGGTERRSPMGFAEVSLTIDNSGEFRIASDYNEITVTRRYYRTGDSEYLINGKTVRLKDITELFMNTGIGKTGYSIIGQGKISEIISQKSEERRYIFEEAAGISKYRYKKQEAERKLVEIDANLVRLTDIVSVLEERVGPLEKDAAKARIYLDLYAEKKERDIAVAVYDISSVAQQAEALEREYTMAKHSLEIADDTLSSLDKHSQTVYTRIEENKQSTESNRERHDELTERRHSLESSILVSKNDIEHGRSSMERIDSEITALNASIGSKKAGSDELRVKYERAAHVAGEKKREFDCAYETLENARADVNGLSEELKQATLEKTDCEKRQVERRIRLSALESSQSSLGERKLAIAAEIESASDAYNELAQKVEKSKSQLESYKKRSDEIADQKNAISDECRTVEAESTELAREISALTVNMSSKKEQADTLRRMEEHFEGYQRSVRRVLDASADGLLGGICGPVSKIISVPAKYSTAIETALGSNIQNIIVENEENAKAAIALLKRENAGKATFYPITSMHADKLRIDLKKAAAFKGYIGIADSLVEFDGRYSEIIASLLGRTFVFDNLDNAGDMARYFGFTVRIVTLDGQIINAGGSYTGGSTRRDSGILTRSAEIERLLSEVEEIEKKIKKLTESSATLEKTLAGKKESLAEISDTYMLLATMYRGEESTHDMLKKQLDTQNEQLATLNESADHLLRQDKVGEQLREALEEEIENLNTAIGKLDEKIAELSESREDAEISLTALSEAKNAKLVEITVSQKEEEAAKLAFDNSTAEIADMIKTLALRVEEKNKLSDEAGNITETVAELTARLTELDRQITETAKEAERFAALGREYDAQLADIRERVKSKTDERNLYFENFTKLEAKRSGILVERDKLTEKLHDEYELTFADAVRENKSPITAETRQRTVTELTKLRSKIKELGSVNVGAIEEYAEVRKNYDFMSGQINDLGKSKEDYGNIVTKLEKEMCEQFSEAFKRINENFATVFASLFGGGTAKLMLTDESDVLSSGIEIIVAPPGKVIKNLKALSGGEQVFVAIAILFAIFKVNPPPFCLLDEIESALDEVNVDRFANYAKNYCDNTQFIIISHRRGTMEAASSLYGVTMQERGVSKLLSINVADAEKKIGIKLNT